MQKNELIKREDTLLRVLDVREDRVLVIDCLKRTVPVWIPVTDLTDCSHCNENSLCEMTGQSFPELDSLPPEARSIARKRYTMICGILPVIGNDTQRNAMIRATAEYWSVSTQTVKSALLKYLVFQNIAVLAPVPRKKPALTHDEKNIRWALNKYFYSSAKHTLQYAYTRMLQEKYCSDDGSLLPSYPSIHQFRYFYKKTKSLQNYYISRNGAADYARNYRPLTGDGVQEIAPAPGVAMLESTVCDIFLVDDAGNLIGRPVFVAAVDAYSSLCMGYALLWEGGMYSLQELLQSIVADKAELCRKHGISVVSSEWDCSGLLPGQLITDKGTEYASSTFEQITELGVMLTNLPPYRPELKGPIEKFFDLIQSMYKPYLQGKGVVEPDFQQRGAHDYRKDACLTLETFEEIILNCIVHYNARRLMESFPLTAEMLESGVKPYASEIWNYGKTLPGANLIPVTAEQVRRTLLPRTEGALTRKGLIVNKLRYHAEGFNDRYLQGGTVTVAYDPMDVSQVWLAEKGDYTAFDLIESRFSGMSFEAAEEMRAQRNTVNQNEAEDCLKAQIALAAHIEAIASRAQHHTNVNRKNVSDTRMKERRKQREGGLYR